MFVVLYSCPFGCRQLHLSSQTNFDRMNLQHCTEKKAIVYLQGSQRLKSSKKWMCHHSHCHRWQASRPSSISCLGPRRKAIHSMLSWPISCLHRAPPLTSLCTLADATEDSLIRPSSLHNSVSMQAAQAFRSLYEWQRFAQVSCKLMTPSVLTNVTLQCGL